MANLAASALKLQQSAIVLTIKNKEREEQKLAQIAALSCQISNDAIRHAISKIVSS
jgi:hypothetical protein